MGRKEQVQPITVNIPSFVEATAPVATLQLCPRVKAAVDNMSTSE